MHQVVNRPRRGTVTFAGTRVPVQALLDHLDQGGELESFLRRHPGLPRDLVNAAIALGLESLLLQVPEAPPPTQRSLLPRQDQAGAIVNAEDLRADQVVGRPVLCPACRRLVFKSWPEGWDGHAARRCRGLGPSDASSRKVEFKRRFGHLFRG